jgi:ribonuclease Z
LPHLSLSTATVNRNVSAFVVQREGELLMFDCGEGTQRQMMRFGTGFSINEIFFTHMHADHFLGTIGLLRTMGLQARTEPISLFAPPGGGRILNDAVQLGVERVPFAVEIHELQPGARLERDGYDIVAYRSEHGGGSLGYALIEHERLGRFNLDRARELGVPEGPLFGKLHRGEAVEIEGRTVRPEDVVGQSRPGRRIVYTGDTRPCSATVEIARGADLLIHEATFGQEEADRARQTGHSTAREAGLVAKRAGARRLLLTHVSARYAEESRLLEREARRVFRATTVAYDGLEIEVPFPPEPESGPEREPKPE